MLELAELSHLAKAQVVIKTLFGLSCVVLKFAIWVYTFSVSSLVFAFWYFFCDDFMDKRTELFF